MIMQRMHTVLAVGLLLAMAPAWAEPTMQRGWKSYRSPDYGFRIDYPKTMTFYPGGPVRPPEKSMFPICDEGTVACFEYNGHALDRTQIQAIGVSVNLLREIDTEAECGRIETDSHPIQTLIIHGVLFHHAETGGGGLGSSRSVSLYRSFYQGSCFEVALVTAQSDLSAQDLKDQGRKAANPRTLRSLDATMKKMLESFTFVGPVNDEAGWRRFTGSDCAETFAYPDSTTVDSEAPSTLPVFNAWQISCLERFTYGQRQYAVAAKKNLPNPEAVAAWLNSTGLPRLDEMQSVPDGPSLTEYRNPDVVYIVHGTSFYLITVTDGSGAPLPISRDGVAEHLVSSFRVE